MSHNLPVLVPPLNVIPSAVAKNIVRYSLLEMRLGQQWKVYSSAHNPSQYVTVAWKKLKNHQMLRSSVVKIRPHKAFSL